MSKVFVGLSGGVDSAVSAALLKEQGHEVVGAFIKIWQPEFIECTWREDRLDAMRVSAALGIPFKEIDLSEDYKKSVIDSMLATYQRGETPNPDVLCNRSIKFGSFAHWARAEGAAYVATGHYARTKQGRLYRGIDAHKDQSYFLHRVGREDLQQALFPIGDLQKTHVRDLAKKFALPVAEKHDSQGLCFVGDISMREFLRRYIDVNEGDVLTVDGAIIGRHEGALLYTIGQRHGFTVLGDAGVPHYVSAIDVQRNTITVTQSKNEATSTEMALKDIHWIGVPPDLPATLDVQVRYRDRAIRATISETHSKTIASFSAPQIASPGQSLVFYDGDECLGGATMERFVHNES
jgi:tRNA-specific 2-thiouridylase